MGQLCSHSGATRSDNRRSENTLFERLQIILEDGDIKSNEQEMYNITKLTEQTMKHDEIAKFLYQEFIDRDDEHHTNNNTNMLEQFQRSKYYKMFMESRQYVNNAIDIKTNHAINLSHFEYQKDLGKGAFGLVSQYKLSSKYCHKGNFKTYAIKVIHKRRVKATDSFDAIKLEFEILKKIKDCRFVTTLHFAFNDENAVYFVMDLIDGGDFKYHLNTRKKFKANETQFYSAQILLALHHIHSKGVIYRDLKLENVLMEKSGYIKLCDFGLSKFYSDNQTTLPSDTVLTFWIHKHCSHIPYHFPDELHDIVIDYIGDSPPVLVRGYAGTPGYCAPEVVLGRSYNNYVDYFSLGVLIYRMLCGKKPFWTKRNQQSKTPAKKKSSILDRNTVEMEPEYDSRYFDPVARNIVRGLLCKSTENRIGCNLRRRTKKKPLMEGIHELYNHPYFDGISFKGMQEQTLKAPYIPDTERETTNMVHLAQTALAILGIDEEETLKFKETFFYVNDTCIEEYVLEVLDDVIAIHDQNNQNVQTV